MQGRDHAGPVIGRGRLAHPRIQLRHAVQHPAFQLGQVVVGNGLRIGKTVEAAEQPAQRVADAPVQLCLLLEDLRADAEVQRGVRIHHPQAQDVGAVLLRDLLRGGDVAERLRHFPALLIEHEAMRQHCAEGCDAIGTDALQERGIEPAAMLVGPLQVEVRREGHAARLQHEGMGGPAFEPDIDNVHHLLVIGGNAPLTQEALRGAGLVPGIRALFREGGRDAVNDGLIAQRLARGLVHEDRDRHAPAALAADAPVGLAGDHRVQPVAAGLRHELRLGDRRQRLGADLVLTVHGDEPLRRGAEDHGLLRAPGMRVAVRQLAGGGERAGGAHRVIDGGVRLEDVQAHKTRGMGGEGAVIVHRLRDRQAMGAAEREVILAMARRDVDEAGAGFGRDEIAGQQRHVELIAMAAQRMRGEGAGKVRALDQPNDGMRADAGVLFELRQQR